MKKRTVKKFLVGSAVSVAALGLLAGPASAEHCYNPNKPAGAGAQVVIDIGTGEPVMLTTGLENRIERGLVNPETGEGYHGIVGLDFDGDGEADISTWQVTPTGSLPDQAIFNGSPDHGIIEIPFG